MMTKVPDPNDDFYNNNEYDDAAFLAASEILNSGLIRGVDALWRAGCEWEDIEVEIENHLENLKENYR
jgi:hypothetical protein